MRIRRFAEEDLEPLVALWHASRPRMPGDRTLTIDDDRRFMVERMIPRNELWVAERAGRPVGFMAIAPGWINQLYVAVEAQRSGVGSALMEHAKSLMDEIHLHTHQANARARAFYARHGFEEVAFGVSPPPESQPDVLLRWRAAPAGRA